MPGDGIRPAERRVQHLPPLMHADTSFAFCVPLPTSAPLPFCKVRNPDAMLLACIRPLACTSARPPKLLKHYVCYPYQADKPEQRRQEARMVAPLTINDIIARRKVASPRRHAIGTVGTLVGPGYAQEQRDAGC